MPKLCIYDYPIPPDSPGLESVIRVGNHSIDRGSHGVEVNYVARINAPSVEQYAFSNYYADIADCLRGCVQNHIDVLNVSQIIPVTPGGEWDKALQEALDTDQGFIVVAAAGNSGPEGHVSWPACDPRVISVGALDPRTGEVAGYSSRGKVDVVACGTWTIPYKSGLKVSDTGTSLAAPVIAAAAARWKEIYPSGTREEFKQFLRDNTSDIDIPGKDPASGWGLFIWTDVWPPKEEVKPMKIIELWPDTGLVKVDGRQVEIDQPPFIVAETRRVVVPLRFVAEVLGYQVDWNAKERKVTITCN